jgi:hypothetical protein
MALLSVQTIVTNSVAQILNLSVAEIVQITVPATLPNGAVTPTVNVWQDFSGQNVIGTVAAGTTSYFVISSPIWVQSATVGQCTATPLGVGVVDSLLYSLPTVGTVYTNSTSETQMAGYTVPANTFYAAGTTIRVRWRGSRTGVNSTDTFQQIMRFGAATLTGTAIVTGTAVNGSATAYFQGEVYITARAAAGGTVACVANGWYIDQSAAGSGTLKQAVMASTNFATNATTVVEVTGTYSAASTSDTAQMESFSVELV